jgi:hypothetical protein
MSGQELFYVRKRAAIIVRTVTLNRLDAHDQSAPFRGSARLDLINSPSGRGPHSGYKRPSSLLSPPYPTQSLFFPASMKFL